jgi:hypothetical protein
MSRKQTDQRTIRVDSDIVRKQVVFINLDMLDVNSSEVDSVEVVLMVTDPHNGRMRRMTRTLSSDHWNRELLRQAFNDEPTITDF